MKIKLTTTFELLRLNHACESGYKTLAKNLGGINKYGKDTEINLLQILESNGVQDALWSLRACKEDEKIKIAQHIACDCAEAVLYIYEKYNNKNTAPRNAIEIARKVIRGELPASAAADASARAAYDAAYAAYDAAARAASAAAYDAAYDDARAASAAAYDAARAAASASAYDAARAAAYAAAAYAADAAAYDARAQIEETQKNIIRSYLLP